MVYWAPIPATEVANTRVHENIRWFPVDELPGARLHHNEIIEYASPPAEQGRVLRTAIFLGEEF